MDLAPYPFGFHAKARRRRRGKRTSSHPAIAMFSRFHPKPLRNDAVPSQWVPARHAPVEDFGAGKLAAEHSDETGKPSAWHDDSLRLYTRIRGESFYALSSHTVSCRATS